MTDLHIGHVTPDESLRALNDGERRKRLAAYRVRYKAVRRERRRKHSEIQAIQRRDQALVVYEGRLGAAITLLENRQPEKGGRDG